MSLLRSILTGSLISVLLAPSAFAVTNMGHLNVEGTYDSAAELDAACRALLGVGHNVERDNSVLFQVRRCINSYYKKQKNTSRGVARSARRQRVHMQLFKRSEGYKERQNTRQRSEAAAQINQRSAQVTRSIRDSRKIFSRTRSRERSSVQAKERTNRGRIDSELAAKRSARLFCMNYIGSTRSDCVEKRMAEILEF
ncbi:MAG: hypothetical protein O2904_01050 [bacterium]|nr:hypothetical protein [bacterium]